MQIKRAASIPLAVQDPYFSIWSSSDRLYDADPVHWSGIRQKMRGYVTVDDTVYCFLGDKEFHQTLRQTSVDVTATATEYVLEQEKIRLTLRFTTPLLLEDPLLVSRPCTYVDLGIEKKEACSVRVDWIISSDLVQREQDALVGCAYTRAGTAEIPSYTYASMGRAFQQPLGNSGDNLTIDWGYVYLACTDKGAALQYDAANRAISASLHFEASRETKSMILAYDDLISIHYFGQWRKGYWAEVYADILEAIGAAFADREEVLARAAGVDREIARKAREIGGEPYEFLCSLSYRQAIAAHKLVRDEKGEFLFLSKENDSNGCIGTVDVSYPSVPLFLLYDTEYVKGMLRPVFAFAEKPVWEYDFAPHDVGRYPYAWGQVYGLNAQKANQAFNGAQGAVFPPFYQYPEGSGIYDLRDQMPVEECGNMLILTAVVCMRDQSASFAVPHMETLRTWTDYLLQFGADPGEQLCTDDFAGHLSHNVNLSAKAIMGIEAFAGLAGMAGDHKTAESYHEKAKAMAEDWERRAAAGDHYALSFGSPQTWSLKYNLVWDRYFGSGLFAEEVFEKELAYYTEKCNSYGVPLDSRESYTKSDWILWCAAMAKDRETAERLICPVADYLRESSTRYPFSDWYDTESGAYCHFKGRSVQGGIFMPMLMQERQN